MCVSMIARKGFHSFKSLLTTYCHCLIFHLLKKEVRIIGNV